MKNIIPYNRQKAIDYAYKYALSRNPSFYCFNNLGGNCTNFVSQCLFAGGMPFNHNYPFGWFYKNINNRSPSFTGVQYLYDFLTRANPLRGPFAIEVDISDADIGDIIQFSLGGHFFSHSLIITKLNPYDPSNPYLTANSYDVIDKPLSGYYYTQARALHVMGAR